MKPKVYIKKNPDWNEWVVRIKGRPESSYHTDDYDDALGTKKAMEAEVQKEYEDKCSSYKEDYIKGKVLADAMDAIENHLDKDQIAELVDALETVKLYTGINMRQDFTLGLLKNLEVK